MTLTTNKGGGDGDPARLLAEIRQILIDRMPPSPGALPWWKRKRLLWIGILLSLLFVVDFPTEQSRSADLVVRDGAPLSLVPITQADWTKLGFPRSSEYTLPDHLGQSPVAVPLEVRLFRQGRWYGYSPVQLRRGANGLEVAFTSLVVVEGPTVLTVEMIPARRGLLPIPGTSLPSDADWDQMIEALLRNYAIKSEDALLPLHLFFDYKSRTGRLVIHARPPFGWQRFKSNLATAFGLLK